MVRSETRPLSTLAFGFIGLAVVATAAFALLAIVIIGTPSQKLLIADYQTVTVR